MKRFLLIATVVVVAALLIFAGATTLSAQSQIAQSSAAPWQMSFYPNLDWSGYPVYTQYSSSLNYNWGDHAPGPNMPSANWSMRATMNAYFYGGTYQFSILADDEFVFMIDNVAYMNTINAGLSGKKVIFSVPVSQGNHTVRVDYRQFTGPGYLYTSWDYVKPGDSTPVPPPDRPLPASLPPESAASVQTGYGDFTPCIQQGLHQAQCFHSDGAWNSPDRGSVQMEPQITVWGNCEPADSDVVWTVDATTDPMITKEFRCSKSLAGWFPH